MSKKVHVEFINQNLAYCGEAKAILTTMSEAGYADKFSDGSNLITGVVQQNGEKDKVKIVPWGADNDLPNTIIKLAGKNDVVGSNIRFLVQCGYGLGIKPMIKEVDENGKVRYVDCTDPEVLEFFEDNDIDGFFLEQLTDLVTFETIFPEIILNKEGTKITSLRHLEATFSRFGTLVDSPHKEISKHYYGIWKDGLAPKDLVTTTVLSRYNTLKELEKYVATDRDKGSKKQKERRFVVHIPMPSPGRTYYGYPHWWSIFHSGWYDISEMLPKFKRSLIDNHLAVRYIVYISEEYWKEVLKRANATEGTIDAQIAREEAVRGIMDFLVSQQSKAGGIISTKKLLPSGGASPFEDKYIQIETIDSTMKGGEFIEDSEEANNIICYSMGVHPDLIGATPGKTKGSLGGSNKRELFMIQQAKMSPLRNRLLKSLILVKRFNKWDERLVFAVPEYLFTTLDENKEGKVQTIQTPK